MTPTRLGLATGLITLLVFAVALPQRAPAAVSYQTVALSGQQAPGLPQGVVFASPGGGFVSLSGPIINNQGRVAFRWNIFGIEPVQAAWVGTAGNLQLVAQEVSPPPPTTQFNYDINTILTGLSDSGALAFDSSTLASGLWTGTPGNIQPLALPGDPVPGASPGTVFVTIRPTSTAMSGRTINAAGQTAFRATIAAPGAEQVQSFWVGSPGNLQLYYREGDAATNGPAGATIQTGAFATLNDAGQAAVMAGINIPSVQSGQAIWRVSP